MCSILPFPNDECLTGEAVYAAAIFFSLMGCCRENNVNPKEWMEDALVKVMDREPERMNDYSTLIPL